MRLRRVAAAAVDATSDAQTPLLERRREHPRQVLVVLDDEDAAAPASPSTQLGDGLEQGVAVARPAW